MLASRQAVLEQRDRINRKGKDGGSFIPRAVTISGISPDAPTMSIPLPNYINFDVKNFGVHEKGSLRHIIDRENEIYQIDDLNNNDGELL